MRSTQDKLIKNHDALGDELKLRLDVLTTRFDAISGEPVDLRHQVYLLDIRPSVLESTSSTTSSPHTTSISDVNHEFSERDRCKSNVIVRGLPEPSTNNNLYLNIADDKYALAIIFEKISVTSVEELFVRFPSTL